MLAPEYEFLAEAVDGQEAYRLCITLQPDILITDMRMPMTDGLSLIGMLQKFPKAPQIVALSSYDEYPLVRNVLRNGAIDYLLKLDLNTERLKECLDDARSRIQEHNRPLYRPETRQRIIGELLKSYHPDFDTFDRRIKNNKIHQQKFVYCIMFKAQEVYRFDSILQEEYELFLLSFQSILAECFAGYEEATMLPGKSSEYYVFLFSSVKYDKQTLSQAIRRAIFNLRRYLDITCSAGVGYDFSLARGIVKAARKAENTLHFRFYHAGPVLFHEDCTEVSQLQDLEDMNGLKFREDLLSALDLGQHKMIEKVFTSINDQIQQKRVPQTLLRRELLALYLGILDFGERNGIDESDLLRHSVKSPEQIIEMTSATQIQFWLQSVCNDLLQYTDSIQTEEHQILSKQVLAYIIDHYSEAELSLQFVAGVFNFSPGYLGQVVKEETGVSFSQHLINTRVKHAQQLLLSERKIYEIAELVGIPDQFYFSRIFKRIVGQSPVEYRKNIKIPGN